MKSTVRNFRIGNLVHGVYDDKDGKPQTVLAQISALDTNGMLGDGWDFVLESLDVDKSNDEYDDMNPIPLTEEWLLKFGFKKYGEGKFLIGHQDFTYHITERSLNGFKDGGYFMGIRYDDWDINPTEIYVFEANRGNIKYVHQLQNLYFALTGEELEFKPDTK